MHSSPVNGRSGFTNTLPPARPDFGALARPFTPGQVELRAGRWKENQDRTLSYLRFVDVDRLLYSFRANHGLSTEGAQECSGWEHPTFPFRTHVQGHFLTAWAHSWAVLGDTVCRDKAEYMVAELAKCQANNAAAGFGEGYLSGFPEEHLESLKGGVQRDGRVLYYCLHKTLAGLFDVWRYLGSTQARDILLNFAGWVDRATGVLSYDVMQAVLNSEFGGMNALLTDLYQQTGDDRWLTCARRFEHAVVVDPLAAGEDRLAGLHANTQVPKAIGAAREYKATGEQRYRDIAEHFWDIVVRAHTYIIGGNSVSEHFKEPNAIAAHLGTYTCEGCNTYNMLKLTRELWTLEPDDAAYFDYYERAMLGQVIGWQNPESEHGHITYFTPLGPGSRRGEGPELDDETWCSDYESFWCCQGTALETFTSLMDSVYFHDDSSLFVNLFTPSVLDWAERGLTITQATHYPVSDTTTLTVTGESAGPWTMRIRIPAWTIDAEVRVNDIVQDLAAEPGSYAGITRDWASGDTVSVKLPMRVVVHSANDDPNVIAVMYGPVVLSGNYGDTELDALPELDVHSIGRNGSGGLDFTATADGTTVPLIPFYDAHGHNYTVYWRRRTNAEGV